MALKFFYGGMEFPFQLKLDKRKTIKIEVKEQGKIIVTAPLNCPESIILKCLKEKAPWISKQIVLLKDKKNIQFQNGDKFLFLGKEVILKIIEDKDIKVNNIYLNKNILTVFIKHIDDKEVKKALELWYREKTMEIVVEKINLFQIRFGIHPNSIKVKEQKRRWASCTYKNDLLFNWRCSMVDEKALEYIVVHEMCHFEHKDHSKKFWESVETILPDYKIRKNWLKENGYKVEW